MVSRIIKATGLSLILLFSALAHAEVPEVFRLDLAQIHNFYPETFRERNAQKFRSENTLFYYLNHGEVQMPDSSEVVKAHRYGIVQFPRPEEHVEKGVGIHSEEWVIVLETLSGQSIPFLFRSKPHSQTSYELNQSDTHFNSHVDPLLQRGFALFPMVRSSSSTSAPVVQPQNNSTAQLNEVASSSKRKRPDSETESSPVFKEPSVDLFREVQALKKRCQKLEADSIEKTAELERRNSELNELKMCLYVVGQEVLKLRNQLAFLPTTRSEAPPLVQSNASNLPPEPVTQSQVQPEEVLPASLEELEVLEQGNVSSDLDSEFNWTEFLNSP
jgi:hypothetical protein